MSDRVILCMMSCWELASALTIACNSRSCLRLPQRMRSGRTRLTQRTLASIAQPVLVHSVQQWHTIYLSQCLLGSKLDWSSVCYHTLSVFTSSVVSTWSYLWYSSSVGRYWLSSEVCLHCSDGLYPCYYILRPSQVSVSDDYPLTRLSACSKNYTTTLLLYHILPQVLAYHRWRITESCVRERSGC